MNGCIDVVIVVTLCRVVRGSARYKLKLKFWFAIRAKFSTLPSRSIRKGISLPSTGLSLSAFHG